MANGTFQVFDVNPLFVGSSSTILTQVLDVGFPITFIGSVGAYSKTVNNDDLVNGGVVITHNLNKFISACTVWINTAETVSPDRVTNLDLNTIFIDLSSFADPSNSFIITVL